jgi:hypothetical protein
VYYRNLFGPPPDAGTARRVSNLNVSASTGYDHNDTGNYTGAIDPRLAESGGYGDVTASADFIARGRRSSFTAEGATQISRYHELDGLVAGYGVGAGCTVPFGRQAIRASQTFAYSPFYGVNAFAALPTSVPTDVSLGTPNRAGDTTDLESYTFSTSIDLTRNFSARSSLSLLYDLHAADFTKFPEYNSNDDRAGVRYLHRVTQNATVHLEYGYRTYRYGIEESGVSDRHTQDIIVGVEYSRALTVWRRTVVSFNTGSSVLAGNSGRPGDTNNHLFVTGNATITRAFGRTWEAKAAYNRALQFVDGFAEPALTDAVRGSLTGLFTQRLELLADGAHSSGAIGPGSTDNDFQMTGASVRLRIPVSRHLAVFLQGLAYHYDFQNGVSLPVGFPPTFDRVGVRVGLTTWVPWLTGKD